MFSRRERLPREKFASAIKTGRRVFSEHFLCVIPKDSSGYAVVIPKKVIKLSVQRHLLKRRVLEALRALPSLPPALIVFPKSSARGVHYQDIVAELGSILSSTRS